METEKVAETYVGRPHEFKSYYVVWKLFFGHFSIKRENGLNRTMQYGNCMRIDNIVNLQEV